MLKQRDRAAHNSLHMHKPKRACQGLLRLAAVAVRMHADAALMEAAWRKRVVWGDNHLGPPVHLWLRADTCTADDGGELSSPRHPAMGPKR